MNDKEFVDKVIEADGVCPMNDICERCPFDDCSGSPSDLLAIAKQWLEDNPEEIKEDCTTCKHTSQNNISHTACKRRNELPCGGFYDFPHWEQFIPKQASRKVLSEPDKDGYYYPTKDNLCKLDILTGNYKWEYKPCKKWVKLVDPNLPNIMGTIGSLGALYRFRIPKTKDQLLDEEIEEIIENFKKVNNMSFLDCTDSLIDLMRICLLKDRS